MTAEFDSFPDARLYILVWGETTSASLRWDSAAGIVNKGTKELLNG